MLSSTRSPNWSAVAGSQGTGIGIGAPSQAWPPSPKQSSQKVWKQWRLGLLVWSAPSGSEFGFMIAGSCVAGFDLCLLFELFLMIFHSNIPCKTVCFPSFVSHKRDLRRGCLWESLGIQHGRSRPSPPENWYCWLCQKHLRLLHFKEDFYRRNTTDMMQEKKEKQSL